MGNVGYGNIGAIGVRRSGNVGGDLSEVNMYFFNFESLLTALPSTLQALSATYTRAGTKYNLQNGLFVSYGANEFGTSYDVEESAYGFLAEPAATNIITYSSDFSNAIWSKVHSSAVADADSPESGGGSYKIIPNTTDNRHYLKHSTLIASGTLTTMSIIAKQAGYKYLLIGPDEATSTADECLWDLNLGTVVQAGTNYTNAKIISIGNGWYKCSCQISTTNALRRDPRWAILSNTPTLPADISNSRFTGDGTSGILVWNAQYETGSIATSPIKTTGSTATRAADVLSVATSAIPGFVDSQYTLVDDARQVTLLSGDEVQTLIITDALQENYAKLGRGSDASTVILETKSATVQQVYSSNGAGVGRHSGGISCIVNNTITSVDGVTDGTDVSCAMPVSPTLLVIGGMSGFTSFNGYIYSGRLVTQAINETALNGYTA